MASFALERIKRKISKQAGFYSIDLRPLYRGNAKYQGSRFTLLLV
jgi:hypothetical protein